MERYLDGEEPDVATLKRCIRNGTIKLAFFPTFCGSAFKNKGMQLVLDAVVDYLPNPMEVPPQPEVDLEGNETGEFAIVDPEKPLRALAFKIMDDRFGALTFTRIYSGHLAKGDTVLNTFTGKTERIGRIVEMHANSREEVDSASRRRHRRPGRPQEHPDRSHPVRPQAPGHPGADGLPRPGHLHRRRPQGQGRAEKLGIALPR